MSRPSPEPRARTEDRPGRRQSWTLLTNHGRVLLLIARDPHIRIRDISEAAEVTERSAQAIVGDLTAAGYVSKRRVGRRNVYAVRVGQPFRHPLEVGHTVGELIDVFAPTSAN